ncbi:NAD(P)/FAD-dependent oxidoreductase [Dethiosulfatarculus sandiegensis]|uniref:Thioredoxin reductase n=1 Tax=Dethiosulfatarculus sandiegensis TaxID=1429043 RepID=A0A0D2JTN6_9BACT|nr:NAD(P)/FAD-dependent oxidoreductase [Dethiosulfatarculus sandiegensis]KIX12865.1 thioredoxin reductase [Dethiosulfatarculus sandiegensis]
MNHSARAYDLLIVGGGVCGMTAAIYAARANLSVCILEKEVCGGLVNWTNTVENVPSYPRIHGEELMDKCREHVESLGVEIQEVDGVEVVDFGGRIKEVTTSEGEVYQGKAVIVATGRRPIPFPVKTDFPRVHYCSVCDGAPYKGKDVIVMGGGNSGFDESLFLLNLGVKSVHIVEVFPRCIAAASTQEKARQSGKIKVSTSTKLAEVEALPGGKGRVRLESAINHETRVEEVDGIFCFIGQTPNTGIFQGILDLDGGYIKTNADMETNLPGVFAAGDVIVKRYRQITTAMADGTIAALQAERYIRG